MTIFLHLLNSLSYVRVELIFSRRSYAATVYPMCAEAGCGSQLFPRARGSLSYVRGGWMRNPLEFRRVI